VNLAPFEPELDDFSVEVVKLSLAVFNRFFREARGCLVPLREPLERPEVLLRVEMIVILLAFTFFVWWLFSFW